MALQTTIVPKINPMPIAALWNKFRWRRPEELSVALNRAQFEVYNYLVESDGDLLQRMYTAFDSYVNTPTKERKRAISNLLNANWKRIPAELKMKGEAYRIWIFSGAYAKRAYRGLKQRGYVNINNSEFLSFTGVSPVKDTIFKNYWTVFNGKVGPEGNLILIQKQQYRKGFSVTKYLKYLLDNGFLLTEDELDDETEYTDIDPDFITMTNKEQEIFVFDDILKVERADILAIKATVPKDVDLPGLVMPIVKSKFVPCRTIDEAYSLLVEYNPKFSKLKEVASSKRVDPAKEALITKIRALEKQETALIDFLEKVDAYDNQQGFMGDDDLDITEKPEAVAKLKRDKKESEMRLKVIQKELTSLEKMLKDHLKSAKSKPSLESCQDVKDIKSYFDPLIPKARKPKYKENEHGVFVITFPMDGNLKYEVPIHQILRHFEMLKGWRVNGNEKDERSVAIKGANRVDIVVESHKYLVSIYIALEEL